ncbi:MAG: PKD domain-containing protein [Thermoplasmata archaeon]
MRRMWAGIVVLVVTAMLIAGCPSEANKAPKASMTAEKVVLFVGDTAVFNASASKDPDGKIKSYIWAFGDGATLTETKNKSATHQYTQAGVYNVTLTVKDDKGAKSKPITTVIVVAPLPVASVSSALTFENITFSLDTSALGDRLSEIEWNFADGTAAQKGASVSHQFKDNGTYDVVAKITCSGQTASAKVSVGITNRHPVANISISSPAPYYSNRAIEFTGAASGDLDGTIVNYSWDFGDGKRENGTSVSHKYLTPGVYNIVLTVTDDDGATGSSTFNITVEKDLIIKNVTVETYVDPTNHTRANLQIKIENKGDAKSPGSILINVTSYKADRSIKIDNNSTTNEGTWEPNTPGNSVSVNELLTDGFDVDGTWYFIEVQYQGTVIDSGWYKKG